MVDFFNLKSPLPQKTKDLFHSNQVFSINLLHINSVPVLKTFLFFIFRFKIRDMESNTVLFEIAKPAGNPTIKF